MKDHKCNKNSREELKMTDISTIILTTRRGLKNKSRNCCIHINQRA